MGIKAVLSLPFAKYVVAKNNKWKSNAIEAQKKLLNTLIKKAKNTQFGIDHDFSCIRNYEDWKKNVPIRDYEDLKDIYNKLLMGKKTSYGPENQFIFVKLQEQHQEQNTFLSVKRVCLITSQLQEMLF